MGATVVAVAGGATKCELARRLGADFVIDHQVVDSLSHAVKAVTEERGVDVVFDTVGGSDAREPLRCLAWNGRYLVVGFASGEIPMIKANLTVLKSVSVIGVAYGMSAILDPPANRRDFGQLFRWYQQGLVTPSIGHRFALAEAGAAIATVYDRQAQGKVVLEMPQP
jgi:NADPH2:quinone reductase